MRQRSVAKEICDAGAVRIGGVPAKASQVVRTGDVLRIQLPGRDLELRVLEVPQGNVARRDAGRCFEILHDRRLDPTERVLESLDDEWPPPAGAAPGFGWTPPEGCGPLGLCPAERRPGWT